LIRGWNHCGVEHPRLLGLSKEDNLREQGLVAQHTGPGQVGSMAAVQPGTVAVVVLGSADCNMDVARSAVDALLTCEELMVPDGQLTVTVMNAVAEVLPCPGNSEGELSWLYIIETMGAHQGIKPDGPRVDATSRAPRGKLAQGPSIIKDARVRVVVL
jgi:hypothetical protein